MVSKVGKVGWDMSERGTVTDKQTQQKILTFSHTSKNYLNQKKPT